MTEGDAAEDAGHLAGVPDEFQGSPNDWMFDRCSVKNPDSSNPNRRSASPKNPVVSRIPPIAPYPMRPARPDWSSRYSVRESP